MHLEHLSRYNKPSKELLVDYINHVNRTDIKASQILFENPEVVSEDGLSTTKIRFESDTGWTQAPGILKYWRVELSKRAGTESLLIHVEDNTPEQIFEALLQQYGLLLEPELVELELMTVPLSVAVPSSNLDGFDPGVGDEPYQDVSNYDYTLRFKPEHLIFIGEIKLHVRPAIRLLATSISARMDLRTFYRDGRRDRPPVELLLPHGEVLIQNKGAEYHFNKSEIESILFNIEVGERLVEGHPLLPILKHFTCTNWAAEPSVRTDFNLFGAEVVYNGLVTDQVRLSDPAFGYALVIKIGNSCLNLSGNIRIGYRYASKMLPTNQRYDFAAPPPFIAS